MANVPQLLTLAEVSAALRVSSHTVRAWVRRGRLEPVRICRRLLFNPDDLVRFLAEAKAAPRAESAESSGSSTT
jgi:excisionase family DNA binding protein